MEKCSRISDLEDKLNEETKAKEMLEDFIENQKGSDVSQLKKKTILRPHFQHENQGHFPIALTNYYTVATLSYTTYCRP